MIPVSPLAVVLIASMAAAPTAAPEAVKVTGMVLTETKVEAVTIRAFALGEAVVRQGELLLKPLAESAQAAGTFALALEPASFPLRLEVTAAGHLAAAVELFDPRSRELPPLWLPAGTSIKLRVIAGGRPAAGALVHGELEGEGFVGDGVWRAVVPTRETDAAGTVEAFVPATGNVSVEALARDGRWGSASTTLPAPRGVRCELKSKPLAVVVRNRQGAPVAGVKLGAVGAPVGTAATTDAAGRAEVQIAGRGSSAIVALGEACAARAVAYPQTRPGLTLACEPIAALPIGWSRGGDLLLRPSWLPAALAGGAALRLSGGRGAVPFFGHGGTLAAWSAGMTAQDVEVEDGARSATIRLTPAAAVDGFVVDAGDRPVGGVPVWRWTLPEFARSPSFRGPRGIDMLERSVLPGSVSAADGSFLVTPLLPPLTRLTAVRAGNPPADSGPLQLAPGARAQVTLKLEGGTWLALAVTDPGGRALAGVAASVAPNPDAHSGRMMLRLGGTDRSVTERLAEGASDRDGKVLLRGVRAGALKLKLALSGYVERSVDLEVPAQGLDAGVLVLEPGITVLGRVVDEHGTGIPDAEIRAGTVIGAFGAPVTTSDATGAFAVPDRPREGETYLVARRGEGERSEPVRVALPPQGPVELVIKSRRALTGRVVDEATAAPIGGAKVSARRFMDLTSGGGGMAFTVRMIDATDEVETDGEGRFVVAGVTAGGEYTLQASARGYRALEQKVKMPEAEAPRPLTVLLKPGLSVHGIVREPDGGPASGVTIEASPATTRPGAMTFREEAPTARSGEDGNFVVEGLQPGQVELSAQAEDGATAREVVEAGREELVELQLEGVGGIEGQVVADDGSSVAGATVSAYGPAYNQVDPVTVDGGGSFRLSRLAPAQYQVSAYLDGWAQASGQATVVSGRTATVTLTLKRGGTINGHVLGLAAKELERCQVFSRGARTRPSPDGAYTLAGVPLGPGEVAAFVLPDGKRRTAPVTVEAIDQPVTVDLDFGRGFELSGSVRRRGAPVPGILVEAVGGAGSASGATTTSDSQGLWELSGVEPGQVVVRALDRQGSALAARQLQVTSNARVDLEIPGGTLSGLVVALPDRSPLAGARVVARGDGAAATSRETLTDQTGAFTLEELADGDLSLRAEAEGYTPAEARATVSMGAARDVTLALEEEKRLKLLLRDEDGAIPDQVQLVPVRGGRIDDPIWATCDRAGRASVGSLPAGAYTFLISSGGGAALVNLPVPSAETAVVLRATGSLRVATPVGQAWRVRAVSAESGLSLPVGPWQNPARGEWVDVRGGMLPLRVPAGTWVVQGIAPDGTTREQRLAVPPEGDVLATLQ